MEEWKDGWMDWWVDGQTGWMEWWVGGRMDRRMDGRADGWRDGRTGEDSMPCGSSHNVPTQTAVNLKDSLPL
jgi:hypothetical protein